MGVRAAPVRYALVGCGRIAAAVHLPALASLQKKGAVELVGVCDWNLERASRVAKEFAVPAFGRWEELVDRTQPSAISVCLPPGPNADVAAAAIEAGVHVLCEKPPGRDLKDAERLAAAAAVRPDRVGMIGFNRRHAVLYRAAMARSLALGKPHAFVGRFTRAALGMSPSDTAADWITSDGSHALDLAIATVGLPRTVSVARRAVGAGPDNAWTIHLHSEAASALVWLDFTAGRRVERFEWTGPGYDVTLDLPDSGEWCQQGSAIERWSAPAMTQAAEAWVNYGYLGEYEALLDAIHGGGPRPAADFAYAVDFMRLVQTILECPSGETRTWSRPGRDQVQTRSVTIADAQSAAPARLARPVVRLMQHPAAHERFFAMEDFSRLSRRCDLRVDASDRPMEDVEALVTGWASAFPTAAQLDSARSLQLVVVMGASMRNIHPERLLARGVTLCNTADAIAVSVAEHCLLLALAGLRQLTAVDREMHDGEWPPHRRRLSSRAIMKVRRRLGRVGARLAWHDLRGQTVGLIGWGHVARHVARLLEPFECEVLVASSSISEPQLSTYKVKAASLSEVLAACSVVSIHKGLTASSRGLIGKKELDLLRSGTVLINTARSAIVDEAALIERARRGDIVVGLDVFDVEPLPPRHPLRRLRNVILTPHSASSTPECQRRVGEQALGLLADWIDGKPLPAITASMLANMT